MTRLKSACKLLCRAPLRTAALCLGLAVTVMLLSIGMGYWLATGNIGAMMEEMFTTVALFREAPAYTGNGVGLTAEDHYESLGAFNLEMNELYGRNIWKIAHGEISFEQVEAFEKFHHLMAVTDGEAVTPLTSAGASLAKQNAEMDLPVNMGVFFVTCEGADSYTVPGRGGVWFSYRMKIERALSCHGDYRTLQVLTVDLSDTQYPGLPMLEIGQSYMICGGLELVSETQGELTLLSHLFTGKRETGFWRSAGTVYYMAEGWQSKFPVLSRVDGSFEAFMQSEVGEQWQKTVIPVIEAGVQSVRVIGATDPRRIHAFVQHSAAVVEGRNFTEEESAAGERLCMISTEFAAQNGLAIGDTLSLDLYQVQFDTVTSAADGYARLTRMYGAYADPGADPITERGEYTVVGIFRTESWENSSYAISPNTVIIPSGTLQNTYYHGSIDGVAIILPNGNTEPFSEEAESLGLSHLFEIDDGGYASVMPAVASMKQSSAKIFAMCGALCLLAVLFLLILLTYMQRTDGQIKWRIGESRRGIFADMCLTAGTVTAVASALGCVGSILLYDKAIALMMQSETAGFDRSFSVGAASVEAMGQISGLLQQKPQLFVLLAVGQGVLILGLAIVMAAGAVFGRGGERL
ncbi:MAG: ABC transporter permease [Clostridia bacterium]|nr:ABC transporter permease [Clostridia bacterium]